MSKKILSMLLILCMMFTMLPVSTMAEEADFTVGTRGEIIEFVPLDEKEKTVTVGTSIEDLELPETLMATVRTVPDTVTEIVYGSEEEITVDIPVTWTSEPEYDMDTEGEYVFTPVIDGYTVSAELPRITITVGAATMNPVFSFMSSSNVAQIGETSYSALQEAVNAVESNQTIKLLDNITLTEPVIIPDGNSIDFTLDLNGKTIETGNITAIQHNGTGELTITDSSTEGEQGKITSSVGTFSSIGTVKLTNLGTLNITGGMVQNTASAGCAINPGSNGTVNVLGGTVQATTGNCRAINGGDSISGTVTVNVSGGIVENTSNDGCAIYVGTSKTTISGSALVTSSNSESNSATVFLSPDSTLDIKGGTVQNTKANGVTIRSNSQKRTAINITDGTVRAANGKAIHNEYDGKIIISGNALVTSAISDSYSGTIYLKSGSKEDTVLEITGGIVENTDTSTSGRAIYNNASGDIKISNGIVDSAGGTGIFVGDGKIVISSGTPIIRGGGMAMNKAPDLSGYANVRIFGSTTSTIDTNAVEITKEDIDTDAEVKTYKYLKFEPVSLSSACDITEVITPVEANIHGTDITATVSNETTSINVDVTVSTHATWKLYSDLACENEIASKTMNLNVGENKAYIEVTAQDGTTKKYTITITRQGRSYSIYVAGVQVTDDNKDDITAPGITAGKVTYDSDTNTLTLTDANITYAGGNAIKTFLKDLIVDFYGDNTVTSTSSSDDNAFCTESGGSFTFKGEGSLDARGKYSGIYAFDDLIIEGGTIKASGQKVGISTNWGSITISGGNVTAEATTAGDRTCEGYGIAEDHYRTLNLTMSGDAVVTAIGIRGAIGSNNLTTSNTTHNVKAGDSESDAEVVTSPDETTWAKPYVKLIPGSTISGKITDNEGSPIEGATVQIQKDGADFGAPATTDADGKYTTQAVPNGEYTIKISKSGYLDAVIENIDVSGSPVVDKDKELIEIPKQTVTITEEAQSYTYDETGKAFEIKGTSLTGFTVEYYVNDAYTTTAPKNAGKYKVKVTRPEDAIYEAYSKEIADGLEIKKLPVVITWSGTEDLVYTGNPVTISADVTNTVEGDTVNVTLSGDIAETNAGTYRAEVAGVDNANYTIEGGTNLTKAWSIAKAENEWVTPLSIEGWKYGGTAKTPIAAAKFGTVEFTYSDSEDGIYTETVPTNAGTYYVKATVPGTENYDEITTKVSFVISKATVSNGSSSDDDRSSDRDSSSADSSIPVIVTSPSPDKPDSSTQGKIKIDAKVDENGNATVYITNLYVTEIFDKAMKNAKKKGNEKNGITMVLHVVTGSKSVSNVTVNLPKIVQDTIIAKRIVSTVVVVDNPNIQIDMDLEAVEEINSQANSDVNVTAAPADSTKLTDEAQKVVGSRPVFDLKVNYGSGKQVQNFGDGRVTVAIPYTLGENEKAENIYAVYIDDNGKVHWLNDSVYDVENKVLRFSTNHFSIYGAGYREEDHGFTDIENHWAKGDIEFVVRQGLFSGTSETIFSPDMAMTRGMFVTVLGRMAKVDVSGYKESSFTDVKENAYYMSYIEWARLNNIIKGIGNGIFAPDQSITREQMAVIMQNFAKAHGFKLPKVNEEKDFADSDSISAYANEAVQEMQMSGIINGKGGNIFDPQGEATRAEVSAVLRRFMELLISNGAQTY